MHNLPVNTVKLRTNEQIEKKTTNKRTNKMWGRWKCFGGHGIVEIVIVIVSGLFLLIFTLAPTCVQGFYEVTNERKERCAMVKRRGGGRD